MSIFLNRYEIEGNLIRQIEKGRQGRDCGTAYIFLFEGMYRASKEYTRWQFLRHWLLQQEDTLYVCLQASDDAFTRNILHIPLEVFEGKEIPHMVLARMVSLCARIRALIEVMADDPLPDSLSRLQ